MHANKYASSLNKDHGNTFEGENFFNVLYFIIKKNKEIEKSKKEKKFWE